MEDKNMENNSNKMLSVAITTISLLTIMASAAIAPALGKIAAAFSNVSPTTIKMILTLPSLVVIPFSLLSGIISSKYSKKKILLLGIIIYIIAGVGGGFANTVTQILIVRAVFGAGVGLILPLSTSLISDFFEGEKRKDLMGKSSAIASLGGIILQTLSGWLAVYNWRYAFLAYALGIFNFLLIYFFMPEIKIEKKSGLFESKLSLKVIGYTSLGAFIMIAFYIIPTNIAILFENNEKLFSSPKAIFESKEEFLNSLEKGKISEYTVNSFKGMGVDISKEAKLSEVDKNTKWRIQDKDKKLSFLIMKKDGKLDVYKETENKSTISGYALSTMSFFSMLSSYLLKGILGVLGVFAGAFSIILMGIGFLILANANNIPMIFLAVILIGASAGIMMPVLNLKIQKITDMKSRPLAMAIVGCFISLGQFLSPLALKTIETVFNTKEIGLKFKVFAILIFIFALVFIIAAIKLKISERGGKNEN